MNSNPALCSCGHHFRPPPTHHSRPVEAPTTLAIWIHEDFILRAPHWPSSRNETELEGPKRKDLPVHQNFLDATTKTFRLYEQVGRKTIDQLDDDQLAHAANDDTNSIAVIVQHLHGNMLSRFTDFLTSDGEKPWRTRDAEFEPSAATRAEILRQWEDGWRVLFDTLASLEADDVERVVYIRNEGHTVVEAMLRQLSHYAYHVGQMVQIGKELRGAAWQSLSIPRGESANYNEKAFSKEKTRRHFSEAFLERPDEA